MVGTFGAGKTTTIRQLLGTDPVKEKFPATNPGKTTIADAEFVTTTDSEYAAVVTFFDHGTVIRHLAENFVEVGKCVFRKQDDLALLKALLDHRGQRFRFSYLFGAPKQKELTEPDEAFGASEAASSNSSDATQQKFRGLEAFDVVLHELKELTRSVIEEARSLAQSMNWPASEVENYVETQIDEVLSDSPLKNEFLEIATSLIFERIETIGVDGFSFDDGGWPVSWQFGTEGRQEFLEKLETFTSNNRKKFGSLLFPLVNGFRISGPFRPAWISGEYKFIIADSQGLEHSEIGNTQAEMMDRYDVVALVDNAAQPMQGGPWGVVKHLVTSGNGRKLRVLFTHFDSVVGEFSSARERRDHVRDSLVNVVTSKSDELGLVAVRELLAVADGRSFYLSHLHEDLASDDVEKSRTVQQLNKFLESVVGFKSEDVDESDATPVISRTAIRNAVSRATEGFRRRWLGYLGKEYSVDYPKAHWATVKALTRRLGEGWDDEHAHLMPVAQFRTELQTELFKVLGTPERWTVSGVSEEVRDQIVSEIAKSLQVGLRDLASRRIDSTKRRGWFDAYSQSGVGSSKLRADIIVLRVLDGGSPDKFSERFTDLLNDVVSLFEAAAQSGQIFLVD
jgi:hypothetical protein